jgi:hypothetical protein
MKVFRRFGLSVLLIATTACGGVQINPPEADELVGSCWTLSQSAYLIRGSYYRKAGFKGGHLIITEEFRNNHVEEIIGRLEMNTRFEIRRVLKDQGYTNSCWRIEVGIVSGSFTGVLSELPACSISHPPTWLNSRSPLVPVEQLKILPQYAAPCES